MRRFYHFVISLYTIIMLSCSLPHHNEPIASIECGVKPTIRRTFQSGSRAIFDRPQYRIVKILSLRRQNSISTIRISVDRYGRHASDESHKIYSSPDRGISWHQTKDTYRCQQHPSVSHENECIISNADPQTLYRNLSDGNGSFVSVSSDGGKSWNNIKSTIDGSDAIDRMIIVETGMNKASRLFALIKSNERTGLYKSDDFGRTLSLVSSQLIYAKESNIESILYGLKGSLSNINSMGLVISRNSGKSWQYIESAKELFMPLYRSHSPMGIHSWRESDNDSELSLPDFPIDQIEIDPRNPDIIFLRSFKGLYRSKDGGRSFALLPLARDILLGIDNIAIDPVDGRYIFAAVNEDSIYISSDYGCTWNKTMLPE
jgi:hypothetical protein